MFYVLRVRINNNSNNNNKNNNNNSRQRGVGRLVASVCVFVRTLKGKRLELSAPKSVDI